MLFTLRELALKSEPDEEAHDMAAFIVLTLSEIEASVDNTVTAWERRDYWLKADKFRLEWEWAGIYEVKMRRSLKDEDWGQIAVNAAQLMGKCSKVSIPARNRLGTPWTGAWEKFQDQKS